MKKTVLAVVLIAAAIYALSFAVSVGIIKLITICFGWNFSLPSATGIWLIMVLLRAVFHVTVNNKK